MDDYYLTLKPREASPRKKPLREKIIARRKASSSDTYFNVEIIRKQVQRNISKIKSLIGRIKKSEQKQKRTKIINLIKTLVISNKEILVLPEELLLDVDIKKRIFEYLQINKVKNISELENLQKIDHLISKTFSNYPSPIAGKDLIGVQSITPKKQKKKKKSGGKTKSLQNKAHFWR